MLRVARRFVVLLVVSTLALGGLAIIPQNVDASSTYLTPVFLGDVNSEAGSSRFVKLGKANDLLVFWPNNSELWRSDGTLSGTYKLADLRQPHNLRQYETAAASVAYAGFLYFIVESNSGSFMELWRTDGTVSGTTLVKQLEEYNGGTFPIFAVVGSHLFFHSGVTGSGIWKSDGTADGTSPFLNSTTIGFESVSDLIGFQGQLLLSGVTADRTSKVLSNDGVSTGTTVLLERPYYGVGSFSDVNGSYVLWSGAGTYRISSDLSISQLSFADSDRKYFQCGMRQCFWSYGSQMWSTDGTSAGTSMVKTFMLDDLDKGLVTTPVTFQGKGYFTIEAADSGSVGVWETDGTQAGTRRISSVPASNGLVGTPEFLYLHSHTSLSRWARDSSSLVRGKFVDISRSDFDDSGLMEAVGENVFFTPATQVSGQELWVAGDQIDSAALVRDITLTTEDNDTCSPRVALDDGDVVSTVYSDARTSGIVRYSMTSRSSLLFEKENLDRRYGQIPMSNLTKFGSSLLFASGGNPWITSGDVGSATMLKRVTISENAEIGKFLTSDLKSYFFAGDGTADSPAVSGYIWRTDGTALGTHQYVASRNEPYVISGGYLYFHRSNSQQEVGLWRIDLASNVQTELAIGTYQLYDTDTGVFMLGGNAFSFIDTEEGQVQEIESWSPQIPDSEESPIGVVSVRQVFPSGVLYSSAGVEGGLKFSDGTLVGTRTVSKGLPSELSAPYSESKFMFFDSDIEYGFEPRVFDAQAGSLTLLTDASPGSVNSYYQDLGHDSQPAAVIKGKLYFDMIKHRGGSQLYDAGGVSEIWESDGTPGGTRQITNFAEMANGPKYVHCLFASGDYVYFGAFSDAHGREVWGIDTRDLTTSEPPTSTTSPSTTSPSTTSPSTTSPSTTSPSTTSPSTTSPSTTSPSTTSPSTTSPSTTSPSTTSPSTTSPSTTSPSTTSPSTTSPSTTSPSTTSPSTTSPTTTIPPGAVKISRAPSSSFSRNLSVSVNGLKATLLIEPPSVSSKGGKVVSYLVQLRPKKGKVIAKTVTIRSLKAAKFSLTLTKKMSYKLVVIAQQKSGKTLTWNGPSLVAR